MKTVRFGIVGVGNQGSSYIKNIFNKGEIKNATVTAVCDTNSKKIEAIKGDLQGKDVKFYDDYVKMLDDGVCDAVMVETPHYLHPEIVKACLARGIHVICEKPAGVYEDQVREMDEAAIKSSALFTMMFNQRTNCVYRKMKEIVEQGGVGELQRVTWIITDWYRTQTYYDSGSWRATWAGEGGGVLINQCPHQLDLVQWIVGKLPKTVRGFCKFGRWHNIEVEDDVTAYFEYDNGATGVFITTTGEAPGTNRFEISGTKGKLLCENGSLKWFKTAADSREFSLDPKNTFGGAQLECEIVEVETDGKNPQHAGIIQNMVNAILGKEPLFVNGTEGINGVELMNAIEYSGWNGGEEVTLPVDSKKYLDALNERRKTSKIKMTEDGAALNTAGTY